MREVPSEHWEAVLYCASDRALAQASQIGCGVSALETFKNELDFVLCALLWVTLCEQGMEQMDPESPPKLSHAVVLCCIQNYTNGKIKQSGKSKAKGL